MRRNGMVYGRYNLLREESEGYAKLVTALNQFGTQAITKAGTPALVRPPSGCQIQGSSPNVISVLPHLQQCSLTPLFRMS